MMSRRLPDWSAVHRELRRKGVTLFLLWQEYKAAHPDDGYQYSQFCQRYRQWAGTLDVCMRQEHKAGERLFVDWAGQTVAVTDPTTGAVRQAQIFVAALGASNYTYAEATWTQSLPDWIAAHIRAWEALGGVTALTIFESIRHHSHTQALEVFGKGACFYSLQHEETSRVDFYRACVVDGIGHVMHERLFAVEISETGEPRLRETGMLGIFTPAEPPDGPPSFAVAPEESAWIHEQALQPFLKETRSERLAEVERIAQHVELSLTELLQRADEEIGRASEEVQR